MGDGEILEEVKRKTYFLNGELTFTMVMEDLVMSFTVIVSTYFRSVVRCNVCVGGMNCLCDFADCKPPTGSDEEEHNVWNKVLGPLLPLPHWTSVSKRSYRS